MTTETLFHWCSKSYNKDGVEEMAHGLVGFGEDIFSPESFDKILNKIKELRGIGKDDHFVLVSLTIIGTRNV